VLECDGPPGQHPCCQRLFCFNWNKDATDHAVFNRGMTPLVYSFQSGWDGILSSDPRSRADLEVIYQRKDGQTNHPDFLSKCVFRVDTSRGDEAPGKMIDDR
jgi:hypothetical protein